MASSRSSNLLEALARARAHVNSLNPDRTQSRRTPNRSTQFNDADNLERQMREDGHSIWGWIIYRCTYDSDEQWQAFLERFTYYVHATLVFHNGQDLESSLDIQVLQEREIFDGATPDVVRQYFKQWADVASELEQGRPAGLAQRYRYCLHVDQEAVESVLAGPEPPEDELGNGYVNIVMIPPGYGAEPDDAEEEAEATEVEEDKEDDEPQLDPAYMRISYVDLLVNWYNLFRPESAWATEYRQPPEIGRT
ncbi:hypothetical protein LTR50_001013 [Elasticomyces elasticus]|nr:hypothetical protein LTR50_001013 [Elasticomyces elasticus]